MDSLVGQLTDTLDQLGLTDKTVISFWGDHGWQLGEHGEWAKHTNFELSTHAPLMVSIPGKTDLGVVTEELVEFVDLMPTLAEAAGLPKVPLCPAGSVVNTCTEGVSMMPLINQPTRPWKSAVFSQYPRMAMDGNVYMGYSMRTKTHRYTEWVDFMGAPDYAPHWSDIFHKESAEMYDHVVDPQENVNLAYRPEEEHLRTALSRQLHKGWRSVLPSIHHHRHEHGHENRYRPY